jgi:hypothetical protein
VAPSVSLGVYAFLTAISVVKPWGLTARGRRLRGHRRDRPVPRRYEREPIHEG